MLVLSRQRNESLMIGDDIEVECVDIRGDKVRLGITAPKDITVHRKEVYEAIKREMRSQNIEAPTPVKVNGKDSPAVPAYESLSLAPNNEWIQTYTGRAIWPHCPDEKDAISIQDIGHALSMKCRFQGHCKYFYSVAQHCCIVSDLLIEYGFALQGLLHDANEAYLPDVPAPIKELISGWHEIEYNIQRQIEDKYQTGPTMIDLVKCYDLIALATERRDLMNPAPYRWHHIEGITPLAEKIRPWTPEKARDEFYQRFEQWRKR